MIVCSFLSHQQQRHTLLSVFSLLTHALLWLRCCPQGNVRSARLLLACGDVCGINVNAVDQHQQTPLHKAIMMGNTEMQELLLQYGALDDIADVVGLSPADALQFVFVFFLRLGVLSRTMLVCLQFHFN